MMLIGDKEIWYMDYAEAQQQVNKSIHKERLFRLTVCRSPLREAEINLMADRKALENKSG